MSKNKNEYEAAKSYIDSLDKLSAKERRLLKRNAERLFFSDPPSVGEMLKNLGKAPAPLSPKVVRLEWIDAQSMNVGLFTAEEIEKIEPVKAEIVGFLVHQSEENYYIAAEYWRETDQYKYLHLIPKKYVVKILEL